MNNMILKAFLRSVSTDVEKLHRDILAAETSEDGFIFCEVTGHWLRPADVEPGYDPSLPFPMIVADFLKLESLQASEVLLAAGPEGEGDPHPVLIGQEVEVDPRSGLTGPEGEGDPHPALTGRGSPADRALFNRFRSYHAEKAKILVAMKSDIDPFETVPVMSGKNEIKNAHLEVMA